MAHWAAPIALE